MNVNTEQDREEENCQDESMFSSIMFFFVLFCSRFRSFLLCSVLCRSVPLRSVPFPFVFPFHSAYSNLITSCSRMTKVCVPTTLNSRPYNSKLASIQL